MTVCYEVVVEWLLLQPTPQVPQEWDVEEQLKIIGDTNEKDSQLVETFLRLSDANVSHCRRSATERIDITTRQPPSALPLESVRKPHAHAGTHAQ